jgi:hypothetical protein
MHLRLFGYYLFGRILYWDIYHYFVSSLISVVTYYLMYDMTVMLTAKHISKYGQWRQVPSVMFLNQRVLLIF